MGFLGGAGCIAFRDHASLIKFDVLVIDFDGIVAEYSDQLEPADGAPCLSFRGSTQLLIDARRWRAAIARFMTAARLIVVGWQRAPTIDVHTMQDILPFSLGDVLPLVAPRIARIPPTMCRAIHGEPFGSFYATLGNISTEGTLSDGRGEPVLTAAGETAAIYLMQMPAHLLLTPWQTAAHATDAIAALAVRLLGAAGVISLPAWSNEFDWPDECAVATTLDRLSREQSALAATIATARDHAATLRALRGIVAGSLNQATAVVRDGCRALGNAVLHEFADDHALVVMDRPGITRLLMLVHDTADLESVATRIRALDDELKRAFDLATALVVVISGAHGQTMARALSPQFNSARVATDGDIQFITTYELLQTLC